MAQSAARRSSSSSCSVLKEVEHTQKVTLSLVKAANIDVHAREGLLAILYSSKESWNHSQTSVLVIYSLFIRTMEHCFHMCDRMMIYVFIAASYAPW